MVSVEASSGDRQGSPVADHHLERFKLDGWWGQWPVVSYVALFYSQGSARFTLN